MKRPNYWQPGMELPRISAITQYTGQGLISGMKVRGGATVTLIPVRWETRIEWEERVAKDDQEWA
jgi:hypothetical protein